MSTKRIISIEAFEEMATALRALADASDAALSQMKSVGAVDLTSTNYPTGLRGFRHVYAFIADASGSVNIAKHKHVLEAILETDRKINSNPKNKAEGKGKVGRPKKKS